MADPSGIKFRIVTNADIPTPANGKVHAFFTSLGAYYKTATGLIKAFSSLLTFDAQADFGFVGDLVTTNATTSMAAASNVLNDTSNPFTAADVGKRITIPRAGAGASPNIAQLTTTIATFVSASQVTLTDACVNAVVNISVTYGTDNTAAINTMVTLVNTTNAAFPGVKIYFGQSPTNAYGFPIRVVFNKPVQIQGIGGGYTSDVGSYTRTGGTRLAWWGVNSDGGTDFGAFFEFSPISTQALKRVAFRSCWIDCRNNDQNQALFGVKLASCHGFMIDDFFICNALAMGLWTNVSPNPTEVKDTTRFMISNACFRQLDNPPVAMTAPILMTSAVALTTVAQNLTVAANTLPTSGYLWTVSNMGYPVLVKYTGGGGTVTLTGCTVSTEDVVNAPSTVNGGNVVQAVPGNGGAWLADGTTTANTCCGMVEMVQISHGTTWGPAAVDFRNCDSIQFLKPVINGGNNTNDGAINRIRKPGIRHNGSNTAATLASRNNSFNAGDPGAGGISSMSLLSTGVKMAFPSGPNYWDLMEMGNGAPIPTVENLVGSGAAFDWNPNGGFRVGCKSNSAVVDQAIAAATLSLVTGTLLTIPPQGLQVGTVFRFVIIGTAAAVGTAANTIAIRLGALGTTADAVIATVTTSVGTAAVSEFMISFEIIIRSLGAAGTAVAQCTILNSSAVGFVTIGTSVLLATMTAFNTVTTGLLYMHASITTGVAKTLTIRQAHTEVIHEGNP